MEKSFGQQIIDALQQKLEARTLEELADDLGMTYQALNNWRGRKNVTPRQIAGLICKAQDAASRRAERQSVRPIVEFFPIAKTKSKQEAKFEIFSARNGNGDDHPYLVGLRDELKMHSGVYIFFDSRGRAIYAGKARLQSLWREMNLAFNRKRDDLQQICRVRHPSRNVRYKTSDEKARQIISVSVPLHELAGYFSAYDVADEMIGVVEAMLVRSFANDLLNKRMEKFANRSKRNARG